MPKNEGFSLRVPADVMEQIEAIQREFELALGFTPSIADVIRYLVKHRPVLGVGSVTPNGVIEVTQ